MTPFFRFFVASQIAEGFGLEKQRSMQLGLVASVMSGTQSVALVALLARREADALAPPTPKDPKDPKNETKTGAKAL